MHFGRAAAFVAVGVVGVVLLSGCGAGDSQPTSSVTTAATVSTSEPTNAPITSSAAIADQAAAAAAEAARVAAAQQSAAQQSAAQLAIVAQQSAADDAARDAAARAAQDEATRVAAEQSSAAEQGAAEQAAADSAAQQAADDLYATGWYDERGWVSPESAARARDAGIVAGGSVPGYLRCGTICGESPTSGEVQQQYLEDQGLLNPDGSRKNDPCSDGYPSGGTCYPNYEAAAAACGGYLIRGNCYPSAEAAAAAGEGE